MGYCIFKVARENDHVTKNFKKITNENPEYQEYDAFLNWKYGTSIEENEDYIPYLRNKQAIMVLPNDCFEPTGLENVFEILEDVLYVDGAGDSDEKNFNN